jgi:peroxiredoxin/glutaredoxin
MRVSMEGQRVPAAKLAEMTEGGVRMLETRDLFADRRVIVFALPGAFTPTCSTAHVPGYVALLGEFKATGIEEVICLSVNDPYVMKAWQQSEKAQGIRFVADPFGQLTEAMGMTVDHRESLLGTRSWRYSMLVEDGTIRKMFIEPEEGDDPFKVSDAQTMLRHLQPNRKILGPVLVLARHGCPYCQRAKALLNERNIPFDAVHLGEELTMRGVQAASRSTTVPQIFIDGHLVGGSDQLVSFLDQEAGNVASSSDVGGSSSAPSS